MLGAIIEIMCSRGTLWVWNDEVAAIFGLNVFHAQDRISCGVVFSIFVFNDVSSVMFVVV